MMPALGDVTVGPGDLTALGRQPPTTRVKRLPPRSVRIRHRARYGSATHVMPADLTTCMPGLASRSPASRPVRSTRPAYLGGAVRTRCLEVVAAPVPAAGQALAGEPPRERQQIKITPDHGAQGRLAVHDNQSHGLLAPPDRDLPAPFAPRPVSPAERVARNTAR
jgi:hypothetical protein